MRTNFYNNYLTEEVLVETLTCGGFRHQPICLYDFTVKNLSHELLNYSTRHLTEDGRDAFINNNYFCRHRAPSNSPRNNSSAYQRRSTMIVS